MLMRSVRGEQVCVVCKGRRRTCEEFMKSASFSRGMPANRRHWAAIADCTIIEHVASVNRSNTARPYALYASSPVGRGHQQMKQTARGVKPLRMASRLWRAAPCMASLRVRPCRLAYRSPQPQSNRAVSDQHRGGEVGVGWLAGRLLRGEGRAGGQGIHSPRWLLAGAARRPPVYLRLLRSGGGHENVACGRWAARDGDDSVRRAENQRRRLHCWAIWLWVGRHTMAEMREAGRESQRV